MIKIKLKNSKTALKYFTYLNKQKGIKNIMIMQIVVTIKSKIFILYNLA